MVIFNPNTNKTYPAQILTYRIDNMTEKIDMQAPAS